MSKYLYSEWRSRHCLWTEQSGAGQAPGSRPGDSTVRHNRGSVNAMTKRVEQLKFESARTREAAEKLTEDAIAASQNTAREMEQAERIVVLVLSRTTWCGQRGERLARQVGRFLAVNKDCESDAQL